MVLSGGSRTYAGMKRGCICMQTGLDHQREWITVRQNLLDHSWTAPLVNFFPLVNERFFNSPHSPCISVRCGNGQSPLDDVFGPPPGSLYASSRLADARRRYSSRTGRLCPKNTHLMMSPSEDDVLNEPFDVSSAHLSPFPHDHKITPGILVLFLFFFLLVCRGRTLTRRCGFLLTLRSLQDFDGWFFKNNR